MPKDVSANELRNRQCPRCGDRLVDEYCECGYDEDDELFDADELGDDPEEDECLRSRSHKP